MKMFSSGETKGSLADWTVSRSSSKGGKIEDGGLDIEYREDGNNYAMEFEDVLLCLRRETETLRAIRMFSHIV